MFFCNYYKDPFKLSYFLYRESSLLFIKSILLIVVVNNYTPVYYLCFHRIGSSDFWQFRTSGSSDTFLRCVHLPLWYLFLVLYYFFFDHQNFPAPSYLATSKPLWADRISCKPCQGSREALVHKVAVWAVVSGTKSKGPCSSSTWDVLPSWRDYLRRNEIHGYA